MSSRRGAKRREASRTQPSPFYIMTTTTTKTIDLSPSWETAVGIYILVLRNPDAGFDAVQAAQEDLLRLARTVDALNTKYTQP